MAVTGTHRAAAGTEVTEPSTIIGYTLNGEAVLVISSGGVASVVPEVAGGNLTWSQVGSRTYGSSNNILFLWKGVGTPNGGNITINWADTPGAPDTWSYILTDIGGHNTGINWVVQSVTNTGTSTAIAATLSAFGAGNALFFAAAIDNNDGISPEAGTTELNQTTRAFFGDTLTTNFRDSEDTSPSATAVTSATWGIIAIEIAVASAAAAAPKRLLTLGVG